MKEDVTSCASSIFIPFFCFFRKGPKIEFLECANIISRVLIDKNETLCSETDAHSSSSAVICVTNWPHLLFR